MRPRERALERAGPRIAAGWPPPGDSLEQSGERGGRARRWRWPHLPRQPSSPHLTLRSSSAVAAAPLCKGRHGPGRLVATAARLRCAALPVFVAPRRARPHRRPRLRRTHRPGRASRPSYPPARDGPQGKPYAADTGILLNSIASLNISRLAAIQRNIRRLLRRILGGSRSSEAPSPVNRNRCSGRPLLSSLAPSRSALCTIPSTEGGGLISSAGLRLASGTLGACFRC